MDEIEELQKFIQDLQAERNECFKEFNDDLPRIVQEARIKRNNMADYNSPNARKKNPQTTKAQKEGLEFNIVYLPGWEEGLFPHQKSLEEKGEKGLEEERLSLIHI